jgi:transcriptional regulator with XRE-family HTH domain
MAEKQTRHNGFTIRALRIKDGHKPGAFATLAGLSYAHLDNLENERKDASDEALYRIANALKVPVDAILRDRHALHPASPLTAVGQ